MQSWKNIYVGYLLKEYQTISAHLGSADQNPKIYISSISLLYENKKIKTSIISKTWNPVS